MASCRRRRCCKRAFFILLVEPLLFLLLLFSLSPSPPLHAARGLPLRAPLCTVAAALLAAVVAVAIEGKKPPTTTSSCGSFCLSFKKSPLCFPAVAPSPAVAPPASAVSFSASRTSSGTGVRFGCAPPTCCSFCSSPPARRGFPLVRLSSIAPVRQRHGLHTGTRGFDLTRGQLLQRSGAHASASPLSFLSPRASPSAASFPLTAVLRESAAPLILPAAAAAAAAAASAAACTPGVPPAAAAAAASAVVPAAAVAPRASAACSAAAAVASSAPSSSSSSGWNTYPAWLQGVWQVRISCFSQECAEETNEAEELKIKKEEGQRWRWPPSSFISAEGEVKTSRLSCVPLLTGGRDRKTVEESACFLPVNSEGKTKNSLPASLPPDASVCALDPCEDLPVLLRAFRSTKSCAGSSGAHPPSSVGRPLASCSSSGACRSSKSSYLTSSRRSGDSSSGKAFSKSEVTGSSGSANFFGNTAASRGPSSSSGSSSSTQRTSSADVLTSDNDSRCKASFYRSRGTCRDPSAPGETRVCFCSTVSHSSGRESSRPRHAVAAQHLLTPLQRRSLALLQEVVGFYDVCLEPAGVLRFELPAHHHAGGRVAGANAAAAPAEGTAPAAAAAATPSLQRNRGTDSAGNCAQAGRAEAARSRRPQEPLKRQQQLEARQHGKQWQEETQEQETRRAAHMQAVGQQQPQQAPHQRPEEQREQQLQQPQASCVLQQRGETLQDFPPPREEQQQLLQQPKSDSCEQSQQQQPAQQLQRRALRQTCRSVHTPQQSQPGRASVQQPEGPSIGKQGTPSCEAIVGIYSGEELQGSVTPLLLQHPLPLCEGCCRQNKLRSCKEKRDEEVGEACIPLSWSFTPASRRLVLLFWLPACTLMLRLSCELRRGGPATCVYGEGPLCLPAAPLPIYVRNKLALASSASASAPSAAGAVAATSAAAYWEEGAAAGTQASRFQDNAEIRWNVAAVCHAESCVDRWEERALPCGSPAQQQAARETATGPASASTAAAGRMKYWRRIASGVWGRGFLYACVPECTDSCDSMQRSCPLHRARQGPPEKEQGAHLQRRQQEQQRRSPQQQTEYWWRQSPHGRSARQTEEVKDDAQEGVGQEGHMRELLFQPHWGQPQVRSKRILLPEQAQMYAASTRVKRSGGMALLGEVSVHLKRPLLSTATTKPISPALRPQQGFLVLRTGQERHAFLQELRALQEVQLQYLRQFFFPRAAQVVSRMEMQQQREQQHESQQEQPPPRQLEDKQQRHGQPQLQSEQQSLLEAQPLEQQQQQGQQEEGHTKQQQQEGQQGQDTQQQQDEVERPEQQGSTKAQYTRKGQQQKHGDHKKEHDPRVCKRRQQSPWAEGHCGLFSGRASEVFEDILHSVKLLFAERERGWYGAGRLLTRQRRRSRIRERPEAEVSRKGSFGSAVARKGRVLERLVSVVTVAVNGKVVGWTLPPPPFPVAALRRFRTAAVAGARSAVDARLPALLSCEEDDEASATREEEAEGGKAVAMESEEECAAAEEGEKEFLSAADGERAAAPEQTKGGAAAGQAALDNYALLAGVQGEEEEGAATGEREEGAAGDGGEHTTSTEGIKQVLAAPKNTHTAAALPVMCQQSDESSSSLHAGKETPNTASGAAAVANGPEARWRGEPAAKPNGAERGVNQFRTAATAAHARDAGTVDAELPNAVLTGESERQRRGAACERKQMGAAASGSMLQTETTGKRETCAVAGEGRTGGAARGPRRSLTAAVPSAQRAAPGTQKTTTEEARVKKKVQQDVAAALLYPAVQRRLGCRPSCVKCVVYVHRSRLVNFVLQETLPRNCLKEGP